MYKTMSSVTPWSSTVQYGVVPYNAIPVNPAISGGLNIQSLVSHENILYLCNKGVIPTINVAPPLQPEAWTQIGVVSVTPTSLSHVTIDDFSSNSDLVNGAVSLSGATVTASSDITVNTTTNIISLPQKKFEGFCFLRPTTNTNGTCYIRFVGTNCTVSSQLMQANTNAANQISNCGVVITPTGANPSVQLIIDSVVNSVKLNNRGNLIQLTSLS